MITSLAHVTVIVNDYDEGIRFYTEVLGLELRADNPMGEGYRWVTVGVKGQEDVDIVLHKPFGEQAPEDMRVSARRISSAAIIRFSTTMSSQLQLIRRSLLPPPSGCGSKRFETEPN